MSGGFLIAADTVATLPGRIPLPGRKKIHAPIGFSKTAFTVTGRGEFWNPPPADVDPVKWFQDRPNRSFSVDDLLMSIIRDRGDVVFSEAELIALGDQLATAYTSYLARHPGLDTQFANTELFRPVIFHYDPAEQIWTTSTFVAKLDDRGHVDAVDFETVRHKPQDQFPLRYFGETAYVESNVGPPGSIGRPFIGEQNVQWWLSQGAINTVNQAEAEVLMRALISATEIAGRFIPSFHLVGGPVDVIFVDGIHPME